MGWLLSQTFTSVEVQQVSAQLPCSLLFASLMLLFIALPSLSPPLGDGALQCTLLCLLLFSNTVEPLHSPEDPQTLIPDSSKEARHTEGKMILFMVRLISF